MSLQQANADSLPSRLEVWERSLEMVRDFPFTGIGMGQFSMVLHGLYVPFLLRSTYVPHAHNFFLQLGLDLGIPGAIAMLCVLGCFFVAMLRIARSAEERELRGAAVGLAAGMVAFLTYGLTDAIAIGARGAIGVWIVLGLGAALYRVTADNWTSMLNQSQRS
jgi:putative inorganic carbon (HCO3(-)) transporter